MSPVERIAARVLDERCIGSCDPGCDDTCVICRHFRHDVATEVAAALRADEGLVERTAEALFAREYGAYSPDAHPDHNRWTWRGDGHSEATKDEFRQQARAALDAITGGDDA